MEYLAQVKRNYSDWQEMNSYKQSSNSECLESTRSLF